MGGIGISAVVTYGIVRWTRVKKPLILKNPISQESKVEGSVETPMRPPKCQVMLGYPNKDGCIEIVGCGIRVGAGCKDYLLTAAHNLAFDDHLYMVAGSNIVKVKEPPSSSISVGTDAAVLEIPTSMWSKLQVTRANYATLPRDTGMYVSIVGVNNKGTSGKLVPENVLGCVTYGSSTMAGYSGAAYFSGNQVYGMHVYGGKRNAGYAAMYLNHLVKIALEIEDEAKIYDRAFFNKIMRNRDPMVRDQVIGDYVIVENQAGYFYRFPKEDYYKFRNDEYEAEHPEVMEEEEDYVEECIQDPSARPVIPNVVSPAKRRAGSTLAVSRLEGAVGSLQKSMTELSQQLQRQQQASRPFYRRRSQQATTTSQPQQTPPPNGGASTSSLAPVNES